MAAGLAFRLALKLGPSLTRYVTSGQPQAGGGGLIVGRYLEERLHDPSEDDEELAAALTAANSYSVEVTTFAEPFELRKFQIQFSRDSGDLRGDDVALFTLHMLKLVAGVPNSNWVAADFDNVRDRFYSEWWTAMAPKYPVSVKLDYVKAYKEGPDIEPPQVPVYSAGPMGLPGTSGEASLPPQCAITVTEKAGSKLHWGRTYLPAPAKGPNTLSAFGRVEGTFQTLIADAMDGLYEDCRAAGTPIVVYRRPLPARTKKNGTELPARAGSAWTVDELVVDNVWDVIRSRRYDGATNRVSRFVEA